MSENIKLKQSRKGRTNNPNGRPAGIPNKKTAEFRETIRKLLEDNSANVSLWLTEVAVDDPARALDLIAKLAEYAAPKLSRQEISGIDGEAVQVQQVRRVIIDPSVSN